MMRRFAVSFAFIVVSLLLLPPAAGQSDRGLWSEPHELGQGWWNSIAVDGEGTVHIGWYGTKAYGSREAPPATDFLTYASRTLNGEWRGPTDVIHTGAGGLTVRNAFAAGPDGILHVAYRGQTNHFVSRAPIASADNALAWAEPDQLQGGYYLDLTIDDDGVLHLVRSQQNINYIDADEDAPINLESDPCAACADLLYHRSIDGGETWSNPVNISNTWDGSEKANIWQSHSGRLYIKWDEGFDWYIGRGTQDSVRFVYSEDGGLTWSDQVILDGGAPVAYRPTQLGLAELHDGSLLAVWRYSSDTKPNIYYQTSDDLGATWTDPEPLIGLYSRPMANSELDDYELIVDHSGIAHLFVAAREASEASSYTNLYHLEYRQGRWQPPVMVFAGSRDIWPEWPKAAIGPQNDIHLSWFNRYVRRTDEGIDPTAGLAVFYAYRPPTLPQRPTEAFIPTPTPPEAVVAQRQFAATPTPFPEVGPLENTDVRTTNDLYAIETLLAAFGASLLFSVGVLVVVGFRPRLGG